ncbi:MAG TPA: hypothetical protein VG269_22775 [Tepidisphaeraceae bacterium]|jgi:predicted transporter|nr:hypothetical protein [Tepidisphaeraceae bacterium]
MLPEYKTKANLGIGVGIVCIILAVVLGLNAVSGGTVNGTLMMLAMLVRLVGAIFFIYGCCMYAKGKGYHPAMGLLGLLFLIGLIVLVVLPDKTKQQAQGFQVIPGGQQPPRL